ncbi:MAG: 30S ribosomal protein S2 [Deltaproteobacteria bacterium]|nr:30S ribosomal protein S2 [Deltaproteobacteria bacterium]
MQHIRGGRPLASLISMKQLLEAGVHFGHQTSKWNPKMKTYIYGARNGIHIIDLQKTVILVKEAYDFIRQVVANGQKVLFVGTKRQAQEPIKEEAERSNMHYVTNRWLGGLLTNFQTVKKSIERMKNLEGMRDDGSFESFKKKEVLGFEREIEKLNYVFNGIRDMKDLPGVMFIVDPKKEKIALAEAKKLGIPVVALVDTNSDPDDIDFVIPANDDAIRAVKLFSEKIAEAGIEGDHKRDEMLQQQAVQAAQQAQEAIKEGSE